MINRERTDAGDSLNRTSATSRPGEVPLTSGKHGSQDSPGASRERNAYSFSDGAERCLSSSMRRSRSSGTGSLATSSNI